MLGLSCGEPAGLDLGVLDTERARPDPAAPPAGAASYTGDNEIVRDAQALYYDGFALHAQVIQPTCGPIGGVCHNAKEYPDLHTPANFIDAVGAPCNVQPGTPQAVYDRCERPGDRLRIGDGQPDLEIATIEYVPGEFTGDGGPPGAGSPGLHVVLAGTLAPGRNDFWTEARFVRSFVNDRGEVAELPFFTLTTRYYIVDAADYRFEDGERGTHLLAQVRPYQASEIEALLSVGVVSGDLNRNGVLGARHESPDTAVRLIVPGHPERSYLIGRMRGSLLGESIPGSRMPLANEPLDNVEMLALFCFIEGLGEGPHAMGSPIDYAGCSYRAHPEDLEWLGTGVSWNGRVKPILEFNCGGCHGGDMPQADLNLAGGSVFQRLLEPSRQLPALALIEPGQPTQSYLWLKVNADPAIDGAPMPIDPLDGDRRLRPQELADLRSWIEEGALPGGPMDGSTDADAGR